MKMIVLKAVALSGLLMTAALTGCASSSYGPAAPADQTSAVAHQPHNRDYAPNYRASTSIGSVMTTPDGATVYTFDEDEAGKSNCYAECAQNWPPVIAGSDAEPYGRMSLADRTDGQRQWAYDGKPLYTFTKDSMHGDVKGENAGSVWHVVR
jgi:predicted lipoprotein with Yx(FWY)xxD motif